jgi:hypothetical protein
MSRSWEERRPSYYAYFDNNKRSLIYGDVRTKNISYDAPCVYEATSHFPAPRGKNLGIFNTLEEAKRAVESELAAQFI